VAKTAVASADGDDFDFSSRLMHDAALRAAEALREFARIAGGGQDVGAPEVTVKIAIDGDEITSSIVAAIKNRRLQ
jgi:hypothetical protein